MKADNLCDVLQCFSVSSKPCLSYTPTPCLCAKALLGTEKRDEEPGRRGKQHRWQQAGLHHPCRNACHDHRLWLVRRSMSHLNSNPRIGGVFRSSFSAKQTWPSR